MIPQSGYSLRPLNILFTHLYYIPTSSFFLLSISRQ